MTSSRLLIIFILASFNVLAMPAYAGFLIPPQPLVFVPPPQPAPPRPHPYLIVVAKGYDFVEFKAGPAPRRGHEINLYKYEPYDPDMATGDDDPTVDPNMNIDR
jgi:hypothetical protein